MKERVRRRHACVLSCQQMLLRGKKIREEYEFGLIDHRGEDKFWAPDAFIECTPMEFPCLRGQRSSGIIVRCCHRGRAVMGDRHYGSYDWNDRPPGASPQPEM